VTSADVDDRLRRLELITDAALSRLSPDAMLDELLDRARDLMRVDTAVVLLIDPHARQLVATAAKGLEEEVRQGFRVSIGRGFAGRVAAEARPIVVDRVTPGKVVNPILHQRGVRSLLGVPMLAHGEVIGVLHVGSLTERSFTAEDIELLELVADRASMAALARLNSIDRTAALALQRSLLPTRLPDVPGIELAARYVPGHASGVGGDWYDVFTLPSGWLGVVVGDVSGHGLPAAVVMGRLRSALRAYSLIYADPAEAITHLDQKVHHFEAGSLATVVYALIPPDRERVHLSLAGHPPPFLTDASGRTEPVPVPTDFPLGLGHPPRRRTTTVCDLPRGAVLVCYTDGLIERRGEIIDVGLERLRAAVSPGSAEEVCARLIASVGVEQPNDDIALLTIRRT
jgi:serine phosphatase RsbU (regulator of sigma subunit)